MYFCRAQCHKSSDGTYGICTFKDQGVEKSDATGVPAPTLRATEPAPSPSSLVISRDGSTLFFGSYGNGVVGEVYAVDAGTGTLVWHTTVAGPVDSSPVESMDGSTLYIGASGLFALDTRTGNLSWPEPAPLGGGTWTRSSPALSPDGSLVFIGARVGHSNAMGSIVAVDTQSGHTVWSQVSAAWVDSSPAVSPDGSTLFVPFTNHSVTAFDAKTGNISWHHDFDSGFTASPAVSMDGAVLYISSIAKLTRTTSSMFVALDAKTGDLQFEYMLASTSNLDQNLRYLQAGVAGEAPERDVHDPSPAVGADGVVYTVGHTANVHMFGLTSAYLSRNLVRGSLEAARGNTGTSQALFDRLCSYKDEIDFVPICNTSAPPGGCNTCPKCCSSFIAADQCAACYAQQCPAGKNTFVADTITLVGVACQEANGLRNGAYGWYGAWANSVAPMSYKFYDYRIKPGSGDMFALLQAYEQQESQFLSEMTDINTMIEWAKASSKAVEQADVPNWLARIRRSHDLLQSYGSAIVQVRAQMTDACLRMEGGLNKLKQQQSTKLDQLRAQLKKDQSDDWKHTFVAVLPEAVKIGMAIESDGESEGESGGEGGAEFISGLGETIEAFKECEACRKDKDAMQSVEQAQQDLATFSQVVSSTAKLNNQITNNATLPQQLPAIETDRFSLDRIGNWFAAFETEMQTTSASKVAVSNWIAASKQHLTLVVSWCQTAVQIQNEQGQLDALRVRAKVVTSYIGTTIKQRAALARSVALAREQRQKQAVMVVKYFMEARKQFRYYALDDTLLPAVTISDDPTPSELEQRIGQLGTAIQLEVQSQSTSPENLGWCYAEITEEREPEVFARLRNVNVP